VNETSFTNKIRDFIESQGGGSLKLGASQFLAKGAPDMVCTMSSVTFFLESKVHPNKLSKIQIAVGKKMRKEGFKVYAIKAMSDHILISGETYEDLSLRFDNIEQALQHIVGIK